MVRAVIVFLIFCLPLNLFAQDQRVKYSVRIGVNFDNLKGSHNGINYHTNSNIGGHMGVVADIHLTTYLYLQPGLMLTTKGGKEGNSRLWLGYFELPVLLSLGLPINNEVNVRFNAGPTIAMGTVSVKSQNYLNGINLFAEDYGLRRFNAGLIIGGGVELGHLYLGLFYEFGLYNISHDGDLKTNSLAFALGHNF